MSGYKKFTSKTARDRNMLRSLVFGHAVYRPTSNMHMQLMNGRRLPAAVGVAQFSAGCNNIVKFEI